MSRYAHVRSLDHAERLLRDQAHAIRELAAGHEFMDAAALRGKAVAYSEAADLLAVLRRKWAAGLLDETSTVAPVQPRIHVGDTR